MTTKVVNGVRVNLTPEEETQRTAEQMTPAEEVIKSEAMAIEAADNILDRDEKFKALALATLDLVFASEQGQLAAMTKPQMKSAFRDRIISHIRAARGL